MTTEQIQKKALTCLTIMCRKCKYVTTTSERIEQCPSCHTSINANHDKFSAVDFLQREHNKANRGKRE